MPVIPVADFDIDKIREEYIGRKGKRNDGLYPVEHDPIRRHEHMCYGRNPLFLDPAYGKASRYGDNIAPTIMADFFAGDGVWPTWAGGDFANQPAIDNIYDIPTVGARAINMNTVHDFYLPVKVGDALWSQIEIIDIYIKPIRIDPLAVWLVTQNRVYNQNDQLVATTTNTLLRHRAPEEIESATA